MVQTSHFLHTPLLNSGQKKLLQQLKARVPRQVGLMWVLSSGTQSQGSMKAIGLRAENFLCSAESVNRHLQSTAQDRWLVAIPHYHVGGLSIYARAHLSGARVFVHQQCWDPRLFVQALVNDQITLTSLVPTQVHDLVQAALPSPGCLRAAVIGGGALSPQLYVRARQLGWPVLPSYGLTECCSQVATASLQSLQNSHFPDLQVLPHVQVELREGRIFLRSQAIGPWVAVIQPSAEFTLEDPCPQGFLATEDLAELADGGLRILGRRDDVVKILGVLVKVDEVEHRLREHFAAAGLRGDVAVLALPDVRNENKLVIFTNGEQSLQTWQAQLARFNAQSGGPQRVHGFCWVPHIPRSEMGKVKKGALRQLL
jgi:O-succinylbenzoic acid--CoA ligase